MEIRMCSARERRGTCAAPIGWRRVFAQMCDGQACGACNTWRVTGRSCDNDTHDRLQRGDGQLQKHPLSSVGFRCAKRRALKMRYRYVTLRRIRSETEGV
jgi:hypothetical protein